MDHLHGSEHDWIHNERRPKEYNVRNCASVLTSSTSRVKTPSNGATGTWCVVSLLWTPVRYARREAPGSKTCRASLSSVCNLPNKKKGILGPKQTAINSVAILQGDSAFELYVYQFAKLIGQQPGVDTEGHVTRPFVVIRTTHGKRFLCLNNADPEKWEEGEECEAIRRHYAWQRGGRKMGEYQRLAATRNYNGHGPRPLSSPPFVQLDPPISGLKLSLVTYIIDIKISIRFRVRRLEINLVLL